MPIYHNNTGSTTLTGASISFFRLLQIKGAVGLECKGLRFRRSVTARAKREFGLRGSRAEVYDALCRMVEDARQQQEHVTTEAGRTVRTVDGAEVQ